MSNDREKPPVLVFRRGDGLYPLDELAAADIRAFGANKPLRLKLTQARSLPQHRLYWALLKKVAENLEGNITKDHMHEWVKLELGLSHTIVDRRGNRREVADSIAIDKMEQPEFAAFFEQVKALIEDRMFPALGDAFEREARAMLGDAA